MRTLLKSALSLGILMTAVEGSPQDGPPLTVIKHGWSRYVSALNTEPEWKTGQMTRTQQIDDRESRSLERGYGDLLRARELRRIERAAARSSVKASDLFLYKVKVRNTDAKTVKNVYWEYQIIDSANPNSASRRQFFCDQKIKTNGVANFEVLSAAPPQAKTISATAAGKRKPAFEERAVINRIEYTDNSAWQRDGWDFSNPAAEFLSTYKRMRGEPPCTTF